MYLKMRLSSSSRSMQPLSISCSIRCLIQAGSGLNLMRRCLVVSVTRFTLSICRRAFMTLMIAASIWYRRSSSTLPCTRKLSYSFTFFETNTEILLRRRLDLQSKLTLILSSRPNEFCAGFFSRSFDLIKGIKCICSSFVGICVIQQIYW